MPALKMTNAKKDQPRPEPSVRAQVVRPKPIVAKVAPLRSRVSVPSSTSASTYKYANATAVTQRGKLIRKTSRQLPASMSQPPRTGPTAPAAAPAAAQIPTARPFVLPVKLWPRIARLLGISMAALAPWPKRAISSNGRFGAAAQASDAKPNRLTPATEQAAAAEAVARCASQEKERAQWKQVGVHNPLKASRVRVKACANRRQPNIDDRAVDERQARRQDGCRDHQSGMARATLAIGGLRECSVAKSMNGSAHGHSLSQPSWYGKRLALFSISYSYAVMSRFRASRKQPNA